jgi:hypothetical protein
MEATLLPTGCGQPVHGPAGEIHRDEGDQEWQRRERARLNERDVTVVAEVLRQPSEEQVLAVRQREIADIEWPQRRTGEQKPRRHRRLRGAFLGLGGFCVLAFRQWIVEIARVAPPCGCAGEPDQAENHENPKR